MHNNPTDPRAPVCDVAVVGGGAVGLTTALLLAREGAHVTLVAPGFGAQDRTGQAPADWRTVAVFADGIALFDALGAWDGMKERATPLAGIRLIDMTSRLFRAPEILFRADEVSLPAFGYNIPGDVIVSALQARVRVAGKISVLDASLVDAEFSDDAAVAHLDDGREVKARVVIAADGRRSLLRDLAGFSVRTWDYDQVAITSHFRHTLPHEDISTELHYEAGPCTNVPMKANASALVWMERPAIARRLCAGDGSGFKDALQTRFGPLLGTLSDIVTPIAVPLTGVIAQSFAQSRVILVGETAHAFPPIGAQGLNLGLRDACEAAGCVLDALSVGGDPGNVAVMRRYHLRRLPDISARTAGVNFLNLSLKGFVPGAPSLRGVGLHVLKASSALRGQVIRQGLQGFGPSPRLLPDGFGVAAQAGSDTRAPALLDG